MHNLIVILGPTASGKTRLAAQLAYFLDTEIISADSRQVYKHLNIGTGKDYNDYLVKNKQITYHLIDNVELEEQYNIHQFKTDCFEIIETLKPKIPILCGGSGMYIDSIISNMDYTEVPVNEAIRSDFKQKSYSELVKYFNSMPITQYTNLADISTAKRLIRAIEINTFLQNNTLQKQKNNIKPILIGLNPERELRRQNIEKRLDFRLKNGLIEEVQNLLKNGILPERLLFLGLEYKFITEYILKKHTFETMKSLLCIAIQQFAKRQMTYFRKMERDGKKIHWFENGETEYEKIVNLIRE